MIIFTSSESQSKKALIDVGNGLEIDEHELNNISEIVNALKSVKAAVEALCRRDASLLTADAILAFAMTQLQNQNTDLSAKLFDALGRRISERRTHLSGVLNYIHQGDFSSLNDSDNEENTNMSAEVSKFFPIPNRKTVESVIINLLTRLDPQENDVEEQVKLYR